MKKTGLLLPVILLCSAAAAQPTIVFPDDAPTPGSTHSVKYAAYQAPGNDGIDQNWDFSGLVADSVGFVSVNEPSGTPGGTDHPNATAAIVAPEGTQFVEADPIGLFLLGAQFLGQPVIFTDAAQYMAYPCTYQTGWETNYSGVLDVFGIELVLSGMVIGYADGYGTLQLPEATITDVLRVRRDDLSEVVSPFGTFELTNTSYLFYKAGFDIPILEIVSTVGDIMGPINIETLRWVDVTAVGITDVQVDGIGVSVLPNPAKDSFQVTIQPNGHRSYITLFDATGRQVRIIDPNIPAGGGYVGTVDVSGLRAGMYLLKVTDDSGRETALRVQVL